MKILTWNVRGINASDKQHRVKQQIDSLSADIILLQETKLSTDTYNKTVSNWSSWNLAHSPGTGASGGLTILWNPKTIYGHSIKHGNNWQLLHFKHFDLSFQIINIYGPSSTQEKRVLWEQVSQIIQEHAEENFILAGDFNAIVNLEENKGGICPPPRTIVDF